MGRRKRRCEDHPDQLVDPDKGCPWCKILKIEEELETIRAREEMFKGKDVILALNSSFDRMIEPILRVLGFKNERRYNLNKDLKEIRIGGPGDNTSYYTIPENMAKAMIEIAEEAQEHLVEAMAYEIQNVRHRVESSIVSDLSDVVSGIVSGNVHNKSLAESIVREIFYNSTASLSYEKEQMLSKKAIKAVKKIIENSLKGKKKGKR